MTGKETTFRFKDFRAKIFWSIDVVKIFTASDDELLVSENAKKFGVTNFVSEIKRVQNYPDFQKLTHVIQHGLQRFILS